MNLDRESRKKMLRTRLWSGLKLQESKNVSRFKYETVREHVQLRIDLRQIEQVLQGSRRAEEANRERSGKRVSERVTSGSTPEVHQHSVQVDDKALKQLEELTRETKILNRVWVEEKRVLEERVLAMQKRVELE